MLTIDERHARRKEIERRLAANHQNSRSDVLFFTSKPLATSQNHPASVIKHDSSLAGVETSSASAGSWFLEHRALMGQPIDEKRLQAASLAASTSHAHHLKLPPIDFLAFDKEKFKPALEAMKEADEKQLSKMADGHLGISRSLSGMNLSLRKTRLDRATSRSLSTKLDFEPPEKLDGDSEPRVLRNIAGHLERWISLQEARMAAITAKQEAEASRQRRLNSILSPSAPLPPPTVPTPTSILLSKYPSCQGLGLELKSMAPYHERDEQMCGVSLAFLIFFSAHVMSHGADSKTPTSQIFEDFIKPRAAKGVGGGRYCDTLHDSCVGVPRYMVSHAWTSPFSHLVSQVSEHFQGCGTSFEHIIIFIDVFSLRTSIATVNHLLVNNKGIWFELFIENVQSLLVVVDESGLVFRRCWVLFEMWLMHKAHPSLLGNGAIFLLLHSLHSTPVLSEIFSSISFEMATTSSPHEDLLTIFDHLRKEEGGIQKANEVVQSIVSTSTIIEAKRAERPLLAMASPRTALSSSSRVISLVVQSIVSQKMLGRLQEAEQELWRILEVITSTSSSFSEGQTSVSGLEEIVFVVVELVDALLTPRPGAVKILDESYEEERKRLPRRAVTLCKAVMSLLEGQRLIPSSDGGPKPQQLTSDHPLHLVVHFQYARALLSLRQLSQAEQSARDLLLKQESLGCTQQEIIPTLVLLSQICQAHYLRHAATTNGGPAIEIESWLLRATSLAASCYGRSHPGSFSSLIALGDFYQVANRHGDAAIFYLQALVSTSLSYPPSSGSRVKANLHLAISLQHLGDLVVSERLLRRLVKVDEEQVSRFKATKPPVSTISSPDPRMQSFKSRSGPDLKHAGINSGDTGEKRLSGLLFSVVSRLVNILVSSAQPVMTIAETASGVSTVVKSQAPATFEMEQEHDFDSEHHVRSSCHSSFPAPMRRINSSSFLVSNKRPSSNSEVSSRPSNEVGNQEAVVPVGAVSFHCLPIHEEEPTDFTEEERQRRRLLNLISRKESVHEDLLNASDDEGDEGQKGHRSQRLMEDVNEEASSLITLLLSWYDMEMQQSLGFAENGALMRKRLERKGSRSTSFSLKSIQSQKSIRQETMKKSERQGSGEEVPHTVFVSRRGERKFRTRPGSRVDSHPDETGNGVNQTSLSLLDDIVSRVQDEIDKETQSKREQEDEAESDEEEEEEKAHDVVSPIGLERRRLLRGLAASLQSHSKLLQQAGDAIGATRCCRLGLTISIHLDGPTDPSTLRSVASLVLMLVLSHIFEEARYQMKLSMEMSGMTTSSREFLRNEVEDLATEAIFTVAEDNDDVELIKALISFGARPYKANGRQLLVTAAAEGRLETCRYLMEYDKLLVDVGEGGGMRPGADVSPESQYDNRYLPGMRPMAAAAMRNHSSVCELLLSLPLTQVNIEDHSGLTALHHAAAHNCIDAATVLLSHKASINARDSRGGLVTPLMIAAACEAVEILQLMIREQQATVQLDLADEDGATALIHACRRVNGYALNPKPYICALTLIHACRNGRAGATEILLTACCKTNQRDVNGYSAMLYACSKGYADILSLLALARADLDSKDNEATTALALACRGGYSTVVEMLLQQRAVIGTRNNDGRTALHEAALSGNIPICNAILTHCMNRGGFGAITASAALDTDLMRTSSLVQARVKGLGIASSTGGNNESLEIRSKVDLALMKVGVKISEASASKSMALAISASKRTPSTVVMASHEDIEAAARSLERMGKGARVMPQVVAFVCIADKFGQTASDLAGEAGHTRLHLLLNDLQAAASPF